MINRDLERIKKHEQETNDTVIVNCSICANARQSFTILPQGDRSEINVWKLTLEQASIAGWEIIAPYGEGNLRDAEWCCPMCVSRRKDKPDYPAFSGRRAACPKCGSGPVGVAFERTIHEHLRRVCQTCGFEWNESCARRKRFRINFVEICLLICIAAYLLVIFLPSIMGARHK